MKKLSLTLALAAILSCAVFAEQPKTISFQNTVSSDTIQLQIADGNTSLAGFRMDEVARAEFESEKLDALIQVGFNWTFPVEKYAQFDWTSDALDYYIEFRPIEQLTFFFHDEVFTRGSKLFVTGQNVASGNLGSDFGICWRPIGGLRIAAGADFLSGIGHDHSRPIINFGIDYTYGSLVNAGVTVRNPFSYTNKVAIGAFVSFTGVKNLTLNAAYTFRGGEFEAGDGGTSGLTAASPVTVPSLTTDLFNHATVLGTHLIQLSASYTQKAVTFAADFAVAPSAVRAYDLYAGADLGYKITDTVKADVRAGLTVDLEGVSNTVISVYPKIDFTIAKNNTISAGAKLQFEGNKMYVALPVAWTYKYKL